MSVIDTLGLNAKAAARRLAQADGALRNGLLAAIRDRLLSACDAILAANALDLEAGQAKGLTPSLLDRLALTRERLEGIAAAIDEVIALPDPCDRVLGGSTRPNGIRIQQVTVPMGVIGMIYEARPNVTVDAAVLCLKAGNAVILRGGKEALQSNLALVRVIREALGDFGDSVQLVEDTSHEVAAELMRCRHLDLLIPRGGARLIRTVVETATVPVIETGVGNCHVYVDRAADLTMAVNILFNAKCQRPSVCNAAETLLVHKDIASEFLPMAQAKLAEKSCRLRCDSAARAILPDTEAATDEDWDTEYLDYVLAVKVVDSFEEAAAHIGRHSTGHSECIVTEDYRAAERFLREVDAAAVYVNASTRFTDGGVFGLGAEIGISTQKLHARGPFGLEALTTTKYLIRGDGQVR